MTGLKIEGELQNQALRGHWIIFNVFMKFIIPKNNSFCGGVQRAFNKVKKSFSREIKKGTNYIIGSLAHNPSVEKKIESWGIKKINNLNKIKKGSRIIITAHGCSRKVVENIKKKGGRIFDTTCPNVKKIHNLVSDYSRRSYNILIFGDKQHKEVKGIKGWCENKPFIFNSVVEARNIIRFLNKNKKGGKFVLVSQTTQSIKKYQSIKKIFKENNQNNEIKIRIYDTICQACQCRQKEAEELSKKHQSVLVIGGGHSANTKRLWQKAKNFNKNVFWIKDIYTDQVEKVKKKLSKNNIQETVLLSGASTPEWEIKQIMKRIKQGSIDVSD